MAFQDTDLLLVNRSSASYKADVGSLKSYLAASGVGANVTASDAPPGSPSAGDIWWNSTDGNLYLYYQDADSSQWVPAFSVGAAGGGEDSPVQSVNSLTGDVVLTTDDIVEGTLKYSRWGTNGTDLYATTGNVGVGTNTPGMPLTVVDSSGAPSLTFDSTGALSLGDSATQMVGGRTAGGSVYLQGRNSSNAAADFILNPLGGNIGIGTDSPTAALSLQPTQGSTSVLNFIAGDTTSDAVRLSVSGNTNNWIEYDAYLGHAFKVQGSTVLSLDSSGGLGFGTAIPSDYPVAFNNICIRETGDSGITIDSGSTSTGGVVFTDLQNGAVRGWIKYNHNLDVLTLGADNSNVAYLRNGKFGIGTANPQQDLEVASTAPRIRITDNNSTADVANGYLEFQGTDSRSAVIYHDSVGLKLQVDAASGGDHIFLTGGSNERMRITDGGNVGIGASNPNRKLTIVDADPVIRLQDSDGTSQMTEIIHASGNSFWDNRNDTNPGAHIFRLYNGTAQEERMRIHNNGFVGIGTSNPAYPLDVQGDGNAYMRIRTTDTDGSLAGLLFGDANSAAPGQINYNNSNDSMQFTVNSGERMRITADGNVGIGTVNPSTDLDVQDSGDNAVIRVWRTDAATAGAVQITSGDVANSITSTGDKAFFIATDNTERMRINGTGEVGIGTNNPRTTLDVNGAAMIGAPTGNASVQIGHGGTESRNAYIDLVGDTTYTDYGFRFIRTDQGANSASEIRHKGTGALNITTEEAGIIRFSTTNTEAMRIDADGNVGIGTGAAAVSNPLTVSGAVNTAARFQNTGGDITLASFAGTSTTQSPQIGCDDDDLVLRTAFAERIRIGAGGNTIIRQDLDVVGAYTGSVNAVGASNTIDCSVGNYFTETVAGAVTFAFTNVPASGKAYGLTLEIDYQSGSIAWPASVYWPLDTAPTLNSGNTQLIVLITSDGGTTWRGNALADFAS